MQYALNNRAVAQTFIELVTYTRSQHALNNACTFTMLRASNSTLAQTM